ncbi:hypothetical protein RHECNPAF_13300169 [Rhizobium etli CNPAF512]|nr:hypothetical protein RHECNPAF_13300169 [Rhizobium etli CNPAF512]
MNLFGLRHQTDGMANLRSPI